MSLVDKGGFMIKKYNERYNAYLFFIVSFISLLTMLLLGVEIVWTICMAMYLSYYLFSKFCEISKYVEGENPLFSEVLLKSLYLYMKGLFCFLWLPLILCYFSIYFLSVENFLFNFEGISKDNLLCLINGDGNNVPLYKYLSTLIVFKWVFLIFNLFLGFYYLKDICSFLYGRLKFEEIYAYIWVIPFVFMASLLLLSFTIDLACAFDFNRWVASLFYGAVECLLMSIIVPLAFVLSSIRNG